MTTREAAAGLVESMPGVCDALDRMGMHILAGFCEDIGPTITTLLSELERVGKELADAIRWMEETGKAAEARALKAEKERDEWKAEAVRVCEPFKAGADRYDQTDYPYDDEDWAITMVGHLRAARAFIEKAKS